MNRSLTSKDTKKEQRVQMHISALSLRPLMLNFPYFSAHLILLFLFSSCGKTTEQSVSQSEATTYASGFSYNKQNEYTLLTVHNPWEKGRILQKYVLVPKAKELPENLPEGTLVRTPLENIVCFSSVICGFLEELGVSQYITGVAESEYIKTPSVKEGIKQGKITDVGQASNPDVEKLFVLHPEVIFANTLQDVGIGQVAKTGIPIIECIEYMETLPLGQTEWIRFLSLFFEKEAEADVLFKDTELRYNTLKDRVKDIEYRPSVLTETLYSGVWYVPGGNSYIARLLADAGANYLWKENTNSGAINCSFEQVLEKAEKADFWLIKDFSPQSTTYKDLVLKNSNYALFDAYKNRRIFVCNTYQAMYYEDIPIHPDRILENLISIFHPEKLEEPEIRYYLPMN